MYQIFGNYLGDEVKMDWEVGGWLELKRHGWLELKVPVGFERERGRVMTATMCYDMYQLLMVGFTKVSPNVMLCLLIIFKIYLVKHANA